jgi:hypothetical protein
MMPWEPNGADLPQEITVPVPPSRMQVVICAAGHVHLTISTDALPVSLDFELNTQQAETLGEGLRRAAYTNKGWV